MSGYYAATRPGAAPNRDPLAFSFVDWPAFTAPPGDQHNRPACAGSERMATIDKSEAAELAAEYCTDCPVFNACNQEAEAIAAERRWAQSPEGVWAGRLWINGKPVKNKTPKKPPPRRLVTCGHPHRRHQAFGMCGSCYKRSRGYGRREAKCIDCGQVKAIYAQGRCGACYMRNKGYSRQSGECVDCGQHKTIYAKGCCSGCYARMYRAERRTKREAVA